MDTVISKITKIEQCEDVIQRAGQIVRQGGLVAFPTETVYGLGADALNPEAARKIYQAKGRPSDNPLIIHVACKDSVNKIVSHISKEAQMLMEQFWPGPMTLIMPKADCVPEETTGGLQTVAVRMPNHSIALALIEASGGYVAAPSANTSGRPSPTKAEHVKEDMEGKIDCILDGGEVGIGIESTIVDLSGEFPMILRPGAITKEMLEAVVGTVEVDRAMISDSSDVKPKAPGMKYRHYAPKAELIVVQGMSDNVVSEINRLARASEPDKVGILCTEETIGRYDYGLVKSIGTREDEKTIAHNLYSVLREFDQSKVEKIYSEAFGTPELGQAVMNRLLKAAGQRKIIV